MLLDFLQPGLLSDVNGDLDYLLVVERFGDTTDPFAHVQALRSFGVNCEFLTTGTFALIEQQIAEGVPVPVGWLHKGDLRAEGPYGGGHWSIVTGFDHDELVVCDPNGEIDLLTGQYLSHALDAGEQVRFSHEHFAPRWEVEGPGTGWMILVH